MIENIEISLAILLLLLLSSFALFLPLLAITKNQGFSLRYTIPVSISVEIIFGYIFYCFNITQYFPIAYLVFAVICNLIAFFILKPTKISVPKISLSTLIVSLLIGAAIFYTRYFDGFSFISPGGNDTYNHIVYVKDLLSRGYLSNGYYAPGFHLFMMPIAKAISVTHLYRFAGGGLGIITILSTFLLFKDHLKNKISLLFLLSLFAFPVFNALTLQTIHFFSSTITFISLASFIGLTNEKVQYRKQSAVVMLIVSVALAVNVPYFFISLIPAFLLLSVAVVLFRKFFSANYLRYTMVISAMLICGFIVSLIHVYIMSSLLDRYYGFPNIQVTANELSPKAEAGKEIDTGEIASKLNIPSSLSANKYIAPMIGAGYNLVKIKDIRPANSMLALGGYAWIAFSFFLVFYSIRKKHYLLFTIAVLSISLGFSTQTGFLEIDTYRGRSGWYLLFLSIIGTAFFADQLISKKNQKLIVALSIILALTGFFYPPKFYRVFYEEEFIALKSLADKYSDTQINIIAHQRQLPIVSTNIRRLATSPDSLSNSGTLLILEKNIKRGDPVLDQTSSSTDTDLSEFNKRFEALQKETQEIDDQITSSQLFANYKKIIENKDFSIYSNFK